MERKGDALLKHTNEQEDVPSDLFNMPKYMRVYGTVMHTSNV